MKLLVIGAKLQGIEAIYLAKKAGYIVSVIDKNEKAPGVELADKYIKADIFNEKEMLPVFMEADVVLPAIEKKDVLKKILEYGKKFDKKIIFDWDAYTISSSKAKSNELFQVNKIPMPELYPECSYPVFIKPDNRSGSEGTLLAYSKEEVEQYLNKTDNDNCIIQKYIEGKSYSLEVIGNGKDYVYPLITEVIVDDDYDCKRIAAPADISKELEMQMMKIGKDLAEAVKIKGIFDIEVLDDNGVLKVLEIDARLPSQTPVSVYNATGINMVELLVESTLNNNMIMLKTRNKYCLYQQIVYKDGKVKMAGEHVMSEISHLKYIENFFGADEAITNYECGLDSWRAIVIITRDSYKEAADAYQKFVDTIEGGSSNDKISE